MCVVALAAASCGHPGRPPRGGSAAPPTSVDVRPTTPGADQPVTSTLSTITDERPGIPATIGPFRLIGATLVLGPASDEGLATVARAGGTEIVYTGSLTVSSALAAEGWVHVGDPDGWGGWLVTPFQGEAGARTKMFEVTSPDGSLSRAVHTLQPGEADNNSFAAVSPDGLWTVSGEWGLESRFLVFPTPGLNRAYAAGSPLPLASTIQLDRAVTDVQGCAFTNAIQMLCDEDAGELVEVNLDRPLDGDNVDPAEVAAIGPLPMSGSCPGTYEPEGVDVDRALGQLRVEISQPGACNLFTAVYEYRL